MTMTEEKNSKDMQLGELVAALCQANMDLWRQEDRARVGDDAQIADAKRKVDKLNQKRNDFIEKIDDFFLRAVAESGKEI